MGIEPTSPAWKAGVIAIIRQPRFNFVRSRALHFGSCRSSPAETQVLYDSRDLTLCARAQPDHGELSRFEASVSTLWLDGTNICRYNHFMRVLVAVLFCLSFLLVFLSCVSPPPAAFEISRHGWKGSEHRVMGLPGSVKILEQDVPRAGFRERIVIHAARGEAESRQILVLAGANGIGELAGTLEAPTGPEGNTLNCEWGLVAYTPVKKPGLRSFGRRGNFPDPIIPAKPTAVDAGKNRLFHLTVRTGRETAPGEYTGNFTISIDTDSPIRVPITVYVYPVALPVTSFLRTSLHWRQENVRDERYYGDNWTEAMSEALHDYALDYRITSRPRLDWEAAVNSGDWTRFDETAAHWIKKGLTSFEIYVLFNLKTTLTEFQQKYAPRLTLLNAHLVERGWEKLFHLYYFDEPFIHEMKTTQALMSAVKTAAPDISQVYTYGTNRAGEKHLQDLAGIWVPNIHQYNAAFHRARQEVGDEVWIYTCIGNIHRRYPDNFRIDWYGASHRALGWWLFVNNIDGYLYWGLDLWRRNPWETAETFPWANGDGMLFYPAPDKTSLPLPSLRAHAMRDSFEDYDLLCLLRDRATRDEAFAADERVQALLAGGGLSDGHIRFDTDDNAYDERHRELLELLSKEQD